MDRQPISAEDLFQLRFLSDPELSQDGQRCAFLVHQAQAASDDYSTELAMARMGPDGISMLPVSRSRKPRGLCWLENQLLCWERAGDGIQLTRLDSEGRELDSRLVPASITAIWAAGPETLLVKMVRGEKKPDSVEVFTEIPFRYNGAGYLNTQRTWLALLPLKTGVIRPVSPDCGEIGTVCVCGDRAYYSIRYRLNRKMKFAALRCCDLRTGEDSQLLPPDIYDIFWAGELAGQVRMFATDMTRYGNVENPAFYAVENGGARMLRDFDEGLTNDVVTDARFGGGQQYVVAEGYLYYIVTLDGCSQIARIDADGNRTVLTGGRGTVCALSARGGRLCYTAERDQRIAELFALEEGREVRLTGCNDGYFAEHWVSPIRQWTVKSNGFDVDSYILLPADYGAREKVPVVVEVHGGPKLAYGPVFFHEMQMLCARGYAVIYCNPKGSDGKGNAFMDVRGRYGQEDFSDVMHVIDDALRRYPRLDGERIGICGGSYGGFFVNWAIGHTNRFACAVSMRSISNMVSMFCTSDIGYRFVADQCDGTPWENPERLWEQSPLKYTDRARTPTLFIHGDEDYRCDDSEAMQMFTALRYHGVESRFCLFKGANHDLSRTGKPAQRLLRLQEITAWLDRFLQNRQTV